MGTNNTTTKHTPGPWRLTYNDDGTLELGGGTTHYTCVDSEAGFGCVAHVLYKKTNILGDSKTLQQKTFEANAKLIAAAPDLLRELQTAVKHIQNIQAKYKPNVPFAIGRYLEAIKKATE